MALPSVGVLCPTAAHGPARESVGQEGEREGGREGGNQGSRCDHTPAIATNVPPGGKRRDVPGCQHLEL